VALRAKHEDAVESATTGRGEKGSEIAKAALLKASQHDSLRMVSAIFDAKDCRRTGKHFHAQMNGAR
jgi:hypothetical protein